MPKWNNKNVIFNRKGNEGGFTWNSRKFLKILKINDFFYVSEKTLEEISRMLITESPIKSYDYNNLFVLFDNIPLESMYATENVDLTLLFSASESIGIKDELVNLSVLAMLNDKFTILEEMKMFASILQKEYINIKEINNVNSYMELLDNYKMYDLEAALKVLISTHDRFGMTDHPPRQAISDFLIGSVDALDKAYDWLVPFDLKIDWNNTDIPVMPEAELTTIEIPGVDGSIVADSIYKDRIFNIVAFSQDGLTVHEKEELKTKITRILDATKNKPKKLTVQANGTSFDVRYQGEAEIKSGPSYIKATIPLHTGPYGYDMFDNELRGNGLVYNDGDSPMGPVHIITGPISNPRFSLGSIDYVWNGNIPSTKKLVINHSKMTCYLLDEHQNKINALSKLYGEFQQIPAGTSVVLNANNETSSHIVTEWKNNVLW